MKLVKYIWSSIQWASGAIVIGYVLFDSKIFTDAVLLNIPQTWVHIALVFILVEWSIGRARNLNVPTASSIYFKPLDDDQYQQLEASIANSEKIELIKEALLRGRKIEAIKIAREAGIAQLKDAKNFVDAMEYRIKNASPAE